MTNLPRMIEPLESRIAPAIIIANPIFDITAATGQSGASIDLGKLVDVSKSYRTTVEFVTNFTLPGQSEPGVIQMELFDDKAPVTVANFLHYLNNRIAAADYDGVIFHRLVKGFVLQGGGFNATAFTEHIDTFAPVHNEYDPTDPERSNVIQTVAMAKVSADNGGGPHSATSEFFINLADNSSNLDAQNGGFTVFGRITDASMPVVNAIANLTLYNGATPVQNFTSGLPTQSQLITITDARVVTSAPGDDGGATFSIESITDATTNDPTKLVTAKLNATTNQLDLKFATGSSGVAKVKVKISKAGEVDEFDEFLVKVQPNLITDVVADGLQSTFVPGDKGTAKVQVINNGGGIAKGKVDVKIYLSKSNGTSNDADGFTLDTATDVLIGTLANANLNVGAGKTATLNVGYVVPAAGLDDGAKYRLLAVVETPMGSTITELFTDDNVGNFRSDTAGLTDPSILRTFDVAFGSVGGRKNVSVTVQDTDGENISFRLTGPGVGTVVKNTNGTVDINLTGTTTASILRITTAKGVVADINELAIEDTIGSVLLGNTHLHGNFAASGGVKSIVFGDLGNTNDAAPENNADKTISIGAYPVATQKLSLKLGHVRDFNLQSDMPIGNLGASEWLNAEANTASNLIAAPSISTLKIGGDFEANVTLVDTAKLALFSVTGSVHGATVRTAGDVGVVLVGDLNASQFLVGLTERPDDLGDFVLGKSIANFQVKGTLSDSVIAAGKITTIGVAAVDATAGTQVGGIYADAIKSYVRKGVTTLKNLDAASVADTVAPNYEVRLF